MFPVVEMVKRPRRLPDDTQEKSSAPLCQQLSSMAVFSPEHPVDSGSFNNVNPFDWKSYSQTLTQSITDSGYSSNTNKWNLSQVEMEGIYPSQENNPNWPYYPAETQQTFPQNGFFTSPNSTNSVGGSQHYQNPNDLNQDAPVMPYNNVFSNDNFAHSLPIPEQITNTIPVEPFKEVNPFAWNPYSQNITDSGYLTTSNFNNERNSSQVEMEGIFPSQENNPNWPYYPADTQQTITQKGFLTSPNSTNSVGGSQHHQHPSELCSFAPLMNFTKDDLVNSLPSPEEIINPNPVESLPNVIFYQRLDDLGKTMGPIIEEYQSFLSAHPNHVTPEIVIDKLRSLKRSFAQNKLTTKNAKVISRKVATKKPTKNGRQYVASTEQFEKMQLRARPKRTVVTEKYANVISSRDKSCTVFDENFGLLHQKTKCRTIGTDGKVAICYLIDIIIENIEKRAVSTVRDIYYKNMRLFQSDTRLATFIQDICVTISDEHSRICRSDLNIVSVPKGVVHGNLVFSIDDRTVDCSANCGNLIPDKADQIEVISSSAKFILVVEKYATFYQLLNEKILNRCDVIMISGCGYPDIRTRSFLQRLWLTLKIPVFGLVDGDAYGIEILCTYRYGSLAMSHENMYLNVPEIKWLGIQADDIVEFRLQGTRFKKTELDRFGHLRKRLYMKEGHPWLEQINKMEALGIKVEIQSLHEYDPQFLLEVYLPYKIQFGGWK